MAQATEDSHASMPRTLQWLNSCRNLAPERPLEKAGVAIFAVHRQALLDCCKCTIGLPLTQQAACLILKMAPEQRPVASRLSNSTVSATLVVNSACAIFNCNKCSTTWNSARRYLPQPARGKALLSTSTCGLHTIGDSLVVNFKPRQRTLIVDDICKRHKRSIVTSSTTNGTGIEGFNHRSWRFGHRRRA